MYILTIYFLIYLFYLYYKQEKIKTIISQKEFIDNVLDVLITSSLFSFLGILLVSFVI